VDFLCDLSGLCVPCACSPGDRSAHAFALRFGPPALQSGLQGAPM